MLFGEDDGNEEGGIRCLSGASVPALVMIPASSPPHRPCCLHTALQNSPSLSVCLSLLPPSHLPSSTHHLLSSDAIVHGGGRGHSPQAALSRCPPCGATSRPGHLRASACVLLSIFGYFPLVLTISTKSEHTNRMTFLSRIVVNELIYLFTSAVCQQAARHTGRSGLSHHEDGV